MPLEVVARTTFEKRGWEVRSQLFFYDKEQDTSRYVDLAAIKAIDKNFLKFKRLNYTIVAECKKSDKPWVFYTPSTKFLTDEWDFATLAYVRPFSNLPLEPKEVLKFLKKNHYVSDKPVDRYAVASYVPFNADDQIFKATNQVLKGLQHQMEWFQQVTKDTSVPPILVVYYPAIIFDGNMFEYVLDNKEEPKLTQTNYVKYDVTYHLRSKPSESESFLIDVITKEFLGEYITMIEREMETLLGS